MLWTKRILAIATSMMAMPALAQGWVQFAQSPTVTQYYDPTSVQSKDGLLQVWTKWDLSQKLKDHYKEIDWQLQVDCANQATRWQVMVERNLDGTVGNTTTGSNVEWTAAPSGTAQATLLSQVCPKK